MTIGIDASRANVVEKTGTEWYSFHIIRHLIRQHPEAHFILYTKEPFRPPLDALVAPHIENRVLKWPLRFLWSQLRLSLEMLLRPPEVLFIPSHTIPLIHPKRTVTTCHDVGFERFPELYGRKRIGQHGIGGLIRTAIVRALTLGRYGTTELDYHRFSMRLAVRSAAAIITVSAFSARELETFYHVPTSRVQVIPLGLDPQDVAVPPDAAAIRQRLTLSRPYLLFTGRLERKKNIRRLVEAYALMQQASDAPDLVLVGNWGEGSDEIQDALSRVSDQTRVHILPWLAPGDFAAVEAGAAIFVMPSLYEGFGLPVLNAFALGVPVVASTSGSLPEIAGDAAVLVDPYDVHALARACQRAFADQPLRSTLIARGHQRVKAYRWETTAERTFAVLNRVAQSPVV